MGAGPRPPDGASTTAHDLAVCRRLLLALSALLTLSLFLSYEGVHGDANPLRTSSAPAVLAIDTALYALDQAQADATATPPSPSEFQKQISVAAQSLSRAAAGDVGGPAGRQAVQTVSGLIAGYTGMIQKAQAEPETSVLREAYLSYATSMLKAGDSGIEARLTELQRGQLAAVGRQTSFGPLLWFGWSVAALFLVALGAALVETQLFLRRRLRRRYNRQLIATGVLSATGFGALLLFTVWTHQGMADTRALLDGAPTGSDIPDAGRHTASYLAHTGFRAAASVWIVIGGVVLMVLTETGLRPHINDYRFRPR
ncbi:hypothetical protein AVL59_12800 [Streptomyces griseochromogenes]|uniref:Uncharacterized protein n=1 Tax=Streptomyces griseochromogenes TaxID=68214 RepID=A0A1B1BCE3_9ACTN|nr:hypothetical protein AVL59_12800 [Streptomyces griseochromogenes]